METGLDRWLSRAGTHPLTISIDGAALNGICQVINRRAGQVQHLKLVSPSEHITLRIEEFIDLRTLSLGGAEDVSEYGIGPFRLAKCLDILRLAPSLIELTLDGPYFGTENSAQSISLHSLQILRLGRADEYGSCSTILKNLKAPALETLVLFNSHIDAKPFLRRIPRLKFLTVQQGKWTRLQFTKLFEAVPSLTHLAIRFRRDRLEGQEEAKLLLVVLGSPTSLPELRTLEIAGGLSSWKLIHSFLLARRQIAVFRFTFIYADTLVQFAAANAWATLAAERRIEVHWSVLSPHKWSHCMGYGDERPEVNHSEEEAENSEEEYAGSSSDGYSVQSALL